ncbi:MAG: nucleotidyltransferase family protein, partial [Myxococcota bacterium]
MRDIDLLIRPRDFGTMCNHLERLDYVRQPYPHAFEVCMKHRRLHLFLDLHFGLTDIEEAKIQLETCFQRSLPSPISPNFRVLPIPEMLLLHIHHMRRNTFARKTTPLIYYVELFNMFLYILRTPQQYRQFQERMHAWHMQQIVMLCAQLFKESGLCPPQEYPILRTFLPQTPSARVRTEILRQLLYILRIQRESASERFWFRRLARLFRTLSCDGVSDMVRSQSNRWIAQIRPLIRILWPQDSPPTSHR